MPKNHRTLFEKWVDRWRVELGLVTWEIAVRWLPRLFPDDGFAIAVCYPEWKYHRALIEVSEPRLLALPEEEWPIVAAHEVLHCVMAGIADGGEGGAAHEEWAATAISKSLHRFYNEQQGKTVRRRAAGGAQAHAGHSPEV